MGNPPPTQKNRKGRIENQNLIRPLRCLCALGVLCGSGWIAELFDLNPGTHLVSGRINDFVGYEAQRCVLVSNGGRHRRRLAGHSPLWQPARKDVGAADAARWGGGRGSRSRPRLSGGLVAPGEDRSRTDDRTDHLLPPINRVLRIDLDESTTAIDSYGDRYRTACGREVRDALLDDGGFDA